MMTESQAAPAPRPSDRADTAGGGERRSFAGHSLVQLTLVRFREFWREPEAVFWTFIFPILLAAGLGLAFRNRPPEVVKIGTTDPALQSVLAREKSLSVRVFDRASGEDALRM